MFDLTPRALITTVGTVLLLMVSASIHEFGHAMAAHLLGDDTAKNQGRLTINPLAHIDPFGSVLLPLIMRLAGGPVFAYAKPVPYNPNNLRTMPRDEVLVAFAGPATNIIQAAVGAIVVRLLVKYDYPALEMGGFAYWLFYFAMSYVYLNCTLAFFNLIPLPPLDGSSIISPLLKGKARMRYYTVQHYAMPILMIMLYVVPMVIGFNPLDFYLDMTAGRLGDLLIGVG